MGLLKDLGFKKENEFVTVVEAEKLNGLTADQIIESFVPRTSYTSDGQISILPISLPLIISQENNQTDWLKYRAVANGLTGDLIINGITQLIENDLNGITTFKIQYIKTRELNVSITGTLTTNIIIDIWL